LSRNTSQSGDSFSEKRETISPEEIYHIDIIYIYIHFCFWHQRCNANSGIGKRAKIINVTITIRDLAVGARILLTGSCDPPCLDRRLNCRREDDQVNDVSGTVREAVDVFNAGKYVYSEGPNKQGHG
jgi:hypothetical protein